MSRIRSSIYKVWDKHLARVSSKAENLPQLKINELLASILTSGPSYHYIVDFTSRELIYNSRNIKEILGIEKEKVCFEDVINIIHPEDIDFVAAAEQALLKQVYQNTSMNSNIRYKSSYCFRGKVADGTYRLFQHQAVMLTTNEAGGMQLVLNIHTDISQLTQENNFIVSLMEVPGNKIYWQMKIEISPLQPGEKPSFTEREKEIIVLISKGWKNPEIANHLFLSPHTVMTHRRNILQKAGVANSIELITYCITNRIL